MTKQDIDWLIVAEKETQAQSYAEALFDKGEPKGMTVKGGLGGHQLSSILGGTVLITRAQGHLFEMAPPHEQNERYDRNGGEVTDDWNMVIRSGWRSEEDMLDEYPVQLDTSTPTGIKYETRTQKHTMLANNLKRLAQRAQRVVVATDGDAEGEMIFQNFRHVKLGKNGLKRDQLYRVLPASMDKKSIQTMFKKTLQRYDKMDPKDSLGNFYLGLEPKGYARAVADYEYGMTYSLLGSLISQRIGDSNDSAIGVWGRLKNTILGHVRQAERDHDNFVPSSQYRVDMVTNNGVKVKGADTLLFDQKEQAEQFIEKNQLPTQLDIQAETKEQSTLPPKLFSRSELLVAVDKRTNMNGVDWNTALQNDYEIHKIVSYPRSDSQHIGNEGFNNLKQYVQQDTIVQLIQSELQENAKHVKDDSAKVSFNLDRKANKKWVDDTKVVPHFALVPNEETSVTPDVLNQLNEEELALYLVDLYQTMTLFLSDTKSTKHHVSVLPHQGKPLFEQTYTKVNEQGWRLLNGDIQKSDDVPRYGTQKVGYAVTEVPAKQPSLLTEASLLNKLKQRNEGTSSTRDKTISVMLEKKGIVKSKKSLRINDSLASIVDHMLDETWINMDQTAQWQSDIDAIENMGQANQFIEEVRQRTQELQHGIREKLNV